MDTLMVCYICYCKEKIAPRWATTLRDSAQVVTNFEALHTIYNDRVTDATLQATLHPVQLLEKKQNSSLPSAEEALVEQKNSMRGQ